MALPAELVGLSCGGRGRSEDSVGVIRNLDVHTAELRATPPKAPSATPEWPKAQSAVTMLGICRSPVDHGVSHIRR
jgi:hypothetical protein